MTRPSVALLASLVLSGGCTIYRGFTPVSGHVTNARTGVPIPGARVTACMVDLHPRAIPVDCAPSRRTRETVTDASGAFHISGSRHLGVFVPQPHQGFPGPFGTSLRIEKGGYVSQHLDCRRNAVLSSGKSLRVELEPVPPPAQ
jgi:hypothetical protein